MSCVCEPIERNGIEFSHFVGEYFHDCVYSPFDYASFVMGWVSIGLFFFALIPQIVENYRIKSVEALSPLFLFAWLFGDIFNLIGCVLAAQLLTQTLTAAYFCVVDAVLMFQLAYYRKRRATAALDAPLLDDHDHAHAHEPARSVPALCLLSLPLLRLLLLSFDSSSLGSGGGGGVFVHTARSLLSSAPLPNCMFAPQLSDGEKLVGSLLSWASGLLYFVSRIPQVLKNYNEKCCEGLSLTMFFVTVSSNLTYGLSIVLRLPKLDETFVLETLPYLIGSVGTLLFDFIIITQTHLYKDKHRYDIQ